MRLALSVCVLAFAAAPVAAQTTCYPTSEQNEGKLLAFYALPIAFSPATLPVRLAPGAVRVSGEVTYVPSPSAEMRRPEQCYGQEKTENTELSPVFPRPRVTVGLPGGFALEASYLPPIEVASAKPNLASLALSYVRPLARGSAGAVWNLLVRAHGTYGYVRGAITCPEDALQNVGLSRACFGTSESKDTYRPNMWGGEVAVAMQERSERLGGYLGAGVTALQPRFEVGFQQSDGYFDNTRISINLMRVAAMAGVSYTVARGALVTLELYSVPQDATTARLGAAYRFR